MDTVMELAPFGITGDDIRRYNEDGAVCLRGVIDAHWIAELKEATERVLEAGAMDMAKKGHKGKFRGDLNVWSKDPGFRAFALEGPSWHIAKILMGATEMRLFSDQLFVKEPGTTAPSPWHQDQTYWPAVGEQICSVWVTMDPVTRESSGLEYIAGSHRWGRRFDPADFGEMSLDFMHADGNETIPDIDANRDAYTFLSWDMEPGDCLVHHSLAVHGAGGNHSSTLRRRAISTRWFGEQAYFRPLPFMDEGAMGMKAGDQMTGPMFPVVPVPEGEAVQGWQVPGF